MQRIGKSFCQLIHIGCLIPEACHQIAPGGLDCIQASRYSLLSLFGSGAGDTELGLNLVDSLDHLIEAYRIDCLGRDLYLVAEHTRIVDQARHFRGSTAVTELQIVKHGIILLCKALISVLYALYGCTHFIRIVGHVSDRLIGDPCRLCGVAVKPLQQ